MNTYQTDLFKGVSQTSATLDSLRKYARETPQHNNASLWKMEVQANVVANSGAFLETVEQCFIATKKGLPFDHVLEKTRATLVARLSSDPDVNFESLARGLRKVQEEEKITLNGIDEQEYYRPSRTIEKV